MTTNGGRASHKESPAPVNITPQIIAPRCPQQLQSSLKSWLTIHRNPKNFHQNAFSINRDALFVLLHADFEKFTKLPNTHLSTATSHCLWAFWMAGSTHLTPTHRPTHTPPPMMPTLPITLLPVILLLTQHKNR